METDNQFRPLLSISFNEQNSQYTIDIGQGMSIQELAFGVMVLTKILIRDGFIKNKREFDRMVTNYYKDGQYSEVPDDEQHGTD